MSTDTDVHTNGQLAERKKFRELLGEFDDAMLVSVDLEGRLHARPMEIVASDEGAADDVWFVTAADSGKASEILREPRVAVTLADGKRFLAITGEARVVVDAAKIERLWQERWKIWFPNGPGGGGIALIQVKPIVAEYWDRSLLNSVSFAFGAAKAWLTNAKMPEPEGPDHHAKLNL